MFPTDQNLFIFNLPVTKITTVNCKLELRVVYACCF